MDDLTKEFLAESLEGLDRMDRCLTELEARPADAELLGEIFRAVHTIKGTTGFLGFSRLEKLAHAGENLLGSLRDGRLTANAAVVNGLLHLMDGLRAILTLIERLGKEGERASDDDHELIALMAELNRTGGTLPIGMVPGTALRESAGSTGAGSSGINEKTLRIDVDVLNHMVNLVGELVLTRNQMLQTDLTAAAFPELTRRLDSVTADLRETVMQARMQPVGHLFSRFPRIVRDLARSCGKTVRLEFSGQETGLDKSLLEAIKDPLTHAVRNAVDHGIENPRERVLAGKAAEGVVSLKAWHQGGSVLIEISDDGAGISTARVRAKALERGLVTAEAAAAMTDAEVQQMVFLPGFSTAATISTVSGRGVGMDVVKNNIEKVGGTIEMESKEGRGTLLRMRVPLTLAIVPALVVRSGGQSFCLPQGALLELVCVPNHEAEVAVERIGQAELYRLRERLLPMVWLDTLLGFEAERGVRCANGFYLAVLESEGCRFGLVVDELMAPEEIVVKPVSSVLREIGLFSGATVLGNGMISMILDVAAVAARGGVRPLVELVPDKAEDVVTKVEQPLFLVFEDRGRSDQPERRALPLRMVERIETVPAAEVQYVGGRAVLQRRGEMLPLEDAGGLLLECTGEATVTLLICRRGSRRVGLVVRQVLDVAGGTMLGEDLELCAEPLAMVSERLTVLHEAFPGSNVDTNLDAAAAWKEVA